METQKQKLKLKNQNLIQKLYKYEHSYFGLYFIFSLVLVYFICQMFHVDAKEYTKLISEINNSVSCTIMGSVFFGAVFGTCHLEYKKAAKKIKQSIQKNNIKIEQLIKTNELNISHQKEKDDPKPVTINYPNQDELESQYLKDIRLSVLQILNDEKDLSEEFPCIEPIDMEEIKEKVRIKRGK